MAEVVQLAKPGAQAQVTQGFVMTESAQDILRSLQLVSAAGDGAITLIAAAPGAGKTEALWHFKNNMRRDAIFHTAVAKEDDTPWGAACQLMEVLEIGRPNSRDMRGSRQRIAEKVGVQGTLIIDEAQNLVHHNLRGGTDWTTLEWFRQMAEEGYFSLVFCGDLSLLETASRLPQLWRRMRRRVVIKNVTNNDVATLARHRGVTEPAVVETLFRVARRGGGLGDVDAAIAHAQLLSGKDIPDAPFVMAALEDLNLLAREDRK